MNAKFDFRWLLLVLLMPLMAAGTSVRGEEPRIILVSGPLNALELQTVNIPADDTIGTAEVWTAEGASYPGIPWNENGYALVDTTLWPEGWLSASPLISGEMELDIDEESEVQATENSRYFEPKPVPELPREVHISGPLNSLVLQAVNIPTSDLAGIAEVWALGQRYELPLDWDENNNVTVDTTAWPAQWESASPIIIGELTLIIDPNSAVELTANPRYFRPKTE